MISLYLTYENLKTRASRYKICFPSMLLSRRANLSVCASGSCLPPSSSAWRRYLHCEKAPSVSASRGPDRTDARAPFNQPLAHNTQTQKEPERLKATKTTQSSTGESSQAEERLTGTSGRRCARRSVLSPAGGKHLLGTAPAAAAAAAPSRTGRRRTRFSRRTSPARGGRRHSATLGAAGK